MQVVELNKESRKAAAMEAEELCRQELMAFEAWRDSLETVPTIKVGPPPGTPGTTSASGLPPALCETAARTFD